MFSPRAVVLAVMAMTMSATPGIAQTTFGLKAGVVSSDGKWGSGDREQAAAPFTKKRSGKAGAAFLRLGGGTVAVQIEGNYTEKGLKIDDGDVISGDVILTYVEVPLLLRFSAPGKISPYVYAGGAAAFEVSCKVKGSAQGTAYDQDCDSNTGGAQPTRRKTDLNAIGGAGIQFALSSVSVLVEGRYALGLQTIDKSTDPVDVKNRAITFMGGVAIPFGGSRHK